MNAVLSTMLFSCPGEKNTEKKGPAAVASGLRRQ